MNKNTVDLRVILLLLCRWWQREEQCCIATLCEFNLNAAVQWIVVESPFVHHLSLFLSLAKCKSSLLH